MSFKGRIGLAGGLTDHSEINLRMIQKRAACTASQLYTYPNSSSSAIDATQPITFTWNTACTVSTPTIDLYLYEPSSSTGLIHAWQGINFADGKYTATMSPKWWNDTTTATVFVSIVDGGGQSFMANTPSGPSFTINYAASSMFSTAASGVATSTNPAAATQSTDAVFQNVASTGNSSTGISKGGIAAAVIVPILALVLLAAVGIRFYRMKEAEKRKRWSKAISSHSNLDWREGAHGNEKPASIYGRPSFGSNNRTSSMFAAENNFAGAGAGPRPSYNLRSHSTPDVNNSNPEMASVRSSVIFAGGNEQQRQSRISFAEIARPDRRSRLSVGESLHQPPANRSSHLFRLPGASKSATDVVSTPSKKSLAYATGSALDDEDEIINISPSQIQGPGAFADAEMRRVGAGNARRTGRRSMLSLGKGGADRRDSTASALSTEDFKTAASARGSVDELRDLEAVMLMRRSMMSQHSHNSPQSIYATQMEDSNQLESLDIDRSKQEAHSTSSPSMSSNSKPSTPIMPTPPTPVMGSQTVAYGPDHMLAVYAARAKANQGSLNVVPTLGPVAAPKPSMSSVKYIPQSAATSSSSSSSSAIGINNEMPPPPTPLGMKSLVHLNNGTVSAAAMGIPNPPSVAVSSASNMDDSGSASASGSGSRLNLGLRIPSFTSTKRNNQGQSTTPSVGSNAASDGSRYSAQADDYYESHAK